MVQYALLVRLEARPGQEDAAEEFLKSALPMAQQEAGTKTWYAWRMGNTFGIFDTFDDEAGRQAHLNGPIAQALMARADELFSSPPDIQSLEVLAQK